MSICHNKSAKVNCQQTITLRPFILPLAQLESSPAVARMAISTDDKKIGSSTIAVLLILSGYLAHSLLYEQQKAEIGREDEPFVRLAYAIETAPASGQDLKQKNVFYPRVIRFPAEVCVQLVPNPGWTDGRGIYCFNPAYAQQSRQTPISAGGKLGVMSPEEQIF
jgi:hypothetical protein